MKLVAVALAVLAGTVCATATAATPCLPGRQAAVLVSYERTGGFAGIHDELTVRRSGRATYVRGLRGATGTFRLSCARLRALRRALVNARFESLAPVYGPDAQVADGFVETVRYRGRAVRVLTGAEPPPRLGRVLALLQFAVARRG